MTLGKKAHTLVPLVDCWPERRSIELSVGLSNGRIMRNAASIMDLSEAAGFLGVMHSCYGPRPAKVDRTMRSGEADLQAISL
jgi:hypothetical protein